MVVVDLEPVFIRALLEAATERSLQDPHGREHDRVALLGGYAALLTALMAAQGHPPPDLLESAQTATARATGHAGISTAEGAS